jgi:hypothetical protein
MSIYSNIVSFARLGKDQLFFFKTSGIAVPVDTDVAGFTTLTLEVSTQRDFVTPIEVLSGSALTRVDAKTVTLDVRGGSALTNYNNVFYKIKRNGVVIGRGQLLDIQTAAKAARRRK